MCVFLPSCPRVFLKKLLGMLLKLALKHYCSHSTFQQKLELKRYSVGVAQLPYVFTPFMLFLKKNSNLKFAKICLEIEFAFITTFGHVLTCTTQISPVVILLRNQPCAPNYFHPCLNYFMFKVHST